MRKQIDVGSLLNYKTWVCIRVFGVIFQSMLQALLKHHKVDYKEEDTLQDEV